MMLRDHEPAAYVREVSRVCLASAEAHAHDPLHVYRRMVRKRFRDVLEASTPRFAKVAGESVMGRWLDRWLDGDGPRTRAFWSLPLTARETLRALVHEGTLPAWQSAIAEYELAVWETRHTPFPGDEEAFELAFDRVPLVTRARLRVTLTHEPRDEESPPVEARYVLFRRRDGSVGARTLNRVAALVLDALVAEGDATLTTRMQHMIARHGLKGGPELAASLGELFAAWLEDGLLLGCRAP